MEKLAATAITVCAGFLFLIGYLYLFGYYNFYDIGINEIDLSVQDIIAHSFISIRYSIQYKWVLLSLILLSVGTSIYLKSGRSISAELIGYCSAGVLLFYLIIFSAQASSIGLKNSKFDSIRKPITVSGNQAILDIKTLFQNQKIWLRHLRTGANISYYLAHNQNGEPGKWVIRISGDSVISVVYLD